MSEESWPDIARHIFAHGNDEERTRCMLYLEAACAEGQPLHAFVRELATAADDEAFVEAALPRLQAIVDGDAADNTKFVAAIALVLAEHGADVFLDVLRTAAADEAEEESDDPLARAMRVAQKEGHPFLFADELLYLASLYAASEESDQTARLQAMAAAIEPRLLADAEARLVELCREQPARREGYELLRAAFPRVGRMLLVAAAGVGEFLNRAWESRPVLARSFEGDDDALMDYAALLALNGLEHAAKRLRGAAKVLSAATAPPEN